MIRVHLRISAEKEPIHQPARHEGKRTRNHQSADIGVHHGSLMHLNVALAREIHPPDQL